MKKLIINLLKFGVSFGIIAYLVVQARGNEAFATLHEQPKHWSLLVAAWALILAGLMLTMVRWHLLVRALELPFRLKDAFRLGFLGYLLNFVSLGSVGGDLFKAIFIAHEHRGRRPEAVATVVVDRVIGLYSMFLVATAAIVANQLWHASVPEVRVISRVTIFGAAVGAIGIVMLLVPGFTSGALSEFLTGLPKVGHVIGKLIGAVRMYRRRPGVLLVALLMSVVVHSMTTIGIYLIARGLPGETPSIGQHFLVVPLALVASALPLPLMGLGAFEAVIEFLYQNLPSPVAVGTGTGLIVALGYRVVTIVNATIGACYYAFSRREVAELMHEAQEAAAEEDEVVAARSSADEAGLSSDAAAPSR